MLSRVLPAGGRPRFDGTRPCRFNVFTTTETIMCQTDYAHDPAMWTGPFRNFAARLLDKDGRELVHFTLQLLGADARQVGRATGRSTPAARKANERLVRFQHAASFWRFAHTHALLRSEIARLDDGSVAREYRRWLRFAEDVFDAPDRPRLVRLARQAGRLQESEAAGGLSDSSSRLRLVQQNLVWLSVVVGLFVQAGGWHKGWVRLVRNLNPHDEADRRFAAEFVRPQPAGWEEFTAGLLEQPPVWLRNAARTMLPTGSLHVPATAPGRDIAAWTKRMRTNGPSYCDQHD